MSLDGICIKYLAEELNGLLQSCVIDKVQQPSRMDILLTFRGRKSSKVLLSANPSFPVVTKTDASFENPLQAPMFCMLLRKHLVGAKLLEVTTDPYERLLYFHFSIRDEIHDTKSRTLAVELMGRYSNIILLDENHIILDSLIHVDDSKSRVREILPARRYQPVPSQNKPIPEDALEALQAAPDVFLSNLQQKPNEKIEKSLLGIAKGFSPLIASEILFRSRLSNTQPISNLTDAEKSTLSNVITQILEHLIQLNSITSSQDGPITFPAYYYADTHKSEGDFHLFLLQHLGQGKKYPSLLSALAKAYDTYFSKDKLQQKKNVLREVLNREEKKKAKLLEAYVSDIESAKDFEEKKASGELIISQLYRLPQHVPESNTIIVLDYYNNNIEKEITLNPRYSVQGNAQNLFRRYNKDKQTFLYATEHRQQVETELEYLESLQSMLENADSLDDIDALKQEINQNFKKKEQPSKGKAKKNTKKAPKREAERALPPRRFSSSSGLAILVGRNNYQNDQLTLRQAQKEDLWFHAKQRPGAHVILRSEGIEPDEDSILEAAAICAHYSRSAGEKLSRQTGKIEIDYCPASHVKKAKGAKPGLVFYENYSTILVDAKLPVEPNVE